MRTLVTGLGPNQLADVCEDPVSYKVTSTGAGGWDWSVSFQGTQLNAGHHANTDQKQAGSQLGSQTQRTPEQDIIVGRKRSI